MKIKPWLLKSEPVYIIAEIGGNFTTLEAAKKLVDAASICGVDAVKLQTYKAETISSKLAKFDMENTGVVSQYELFKKYEINEDLHCDVFEYIESKGLDWFSTPSHESDVDLLEGLGVCAFKIGSDDAVNFPFLKYVARKGRPILLSTGMCTMEEVREAVSCILGEGNRQLILLHAITSYPTHPENVNLLAMVKISKEFGLPVGYSDHTLGNVASVAAVALGAAVLEKHFTTDKNAEGPDHMLSADPHEMKSLVEQVRQLEEMLGNGIKMPAESERTTRVNNRKSIVVKRKLEAGHKITTQDIAIKRPGYGIAPKYFDQIIGRTTTKKLEEDKIVNWDDLS